MSSPNPTPPAEYATQTTLPAQPDPVSGERPPDTSLREPGSSSGGKKNKNPSIRQSRPGTPRQMSPTPSMGSTQNSGSKNADSQLQSRLATPTKKSIFGPKKTSQAVVKGGSSNLREPGSGREIQIFYKGQLVVGMENVMITIDMAPPEEQPAMIAEANTGANGLMDFINHRATAWYEWQMDRLQKLGKWDQNAFDDKYISLATTAKAVIAARNKRAQGLARIRQAWRDDIRGASILATHLDPENKKYQLQGESCLTSFGTIAEKLEPLQAIQLINKQILARALYYFDPTTKKSGKPNFNPGREGSHVVAGDIRSAWMEMTNKDLESGQPPFDKENIELPKKSVMNRLGLVLDLAGFIEMPDPAEKNKLLSQEDESRLEFAYIHCLNDDLTPPAIERNFVSPAQEENEDLVAENLENAQESHTVEPPTNGPVAGTLQPVPEPPAEPQREPATAPPEAPAPVPVEPGLAPEAVEGEDEPELEMSEEVHKFVDESTGMALNNYKAKVKGSFIDLSNEERDKAEARAFRRALLTELAQARAAGEDIDAVARQNRKLLRKPGSSKVFERPNPRNLDREACKCDLSEYVKQRLEHGDLNFLAVPMLERVKLYPTIFPPAENASKAACDFHVRKYAEYVELKVRPKDRGKKIRENLEKLWNHRDDIPSFRIGEGFYLFKRTTQSKFLRKQASLGCQKYLPVPVPDYMEDHHASEICDGYFGPDSVDLKYQGVIVSTIFDAEWLISIDPFETPKGAIGSLYELVAREFRMYMYHSTVGGIKSEGFHLPNMLYSVTQQLVRSDLGLYLAVCAAREDDETRLVAYPDAARYIPYEEEEPETEGWVQADVPDITSKITTRSKKSNPPDISRRICDYVLLTCPQKDTTPRVEIIANGHERTDILVKTKRNGRVFNLLKPGSGTKLTTKIKSQVGDWEALPCSEGSIILARQGTPIALNFAPPENEEGKEALRMISANFTAVTKDGTMLENGVSWEDFHNFCMRLEPPTTPRWIDASKVEHTAEPFRSVVSLTGLSPVGEALLGRLPWTDRSVIDERDRLFEMNGDDLDRYVDKSRTAAIERARMAYQAVFEYEARDYGDRSFAAFSEALQETPDLEPPKADPRFIKEKIVKYCEDGDFSHLIIDRKGVIDISLSYPDGAPRGEEPKVSGNSDVGEPGSARRKRSRKAKKKESRDPQTPREVGQAEKAKVQSVLKGQPARPRDPSPVPFFQKGPAATVVKPSAVIIPEKRDSTPDVEIAEREQEFEKTMEKAFNELADGYLDLETGEVVEGPLISDVPRNALGYPTEGGKGPSEVLSLEEERRKKEAAASRKRKRKGEDPSESSKKKKKPSGRNSATGRFKKQD
jgi:hypothetical protein